MATRSTFDFQAGRTSVRLAKGLEWAMLAIMATGTADSDAVAALVRAAADRGTGGLRGLRHPLTDPLFPAAVLRGRRLLGAPLDPDLLLDTWRGAHARREGSARYLWAIDPAFAGALPPWVSPKDRWVPWRPRDEAALAEWPDGQSAFGERFLTPIILADMIELLSERTGRGPGGAFAEEVLADALPKLRRDAAGWAIETNASADTWALWAIARRPAALAALHPFMLASADGYAATARRNGNVVLGTRFPFHDEPLVSASAQLARGLIALGTHPALTGALATWVRDREQADGGFGDADGPSDLVTTLVACDLLTSLDPAFDPMPAAAFLADRQRPDGWWTALGPETTWLTVEIVNWLGLAGRPFDERFRWPHLPLANRDRRTGLAWYAYYAELERLFEALPGLASARVEIAFLDLAGFGEFNNRHGMAVGDAVLRLLAQELDRIEGTVAIRDGGDEFIVLRAPTGTGLGDRLNEFRQRWTVSLAREFGPDASVGPRVLVGSTRGDRLVAARERLGREIAPLKDAYPTVPNGGIQLELGLLR
jgi:GGDEF domain-containing protein